jgi:DNA-binding transcriptional ArsR family regulator
MHSANKLGRKYDAENGISRAARLITLVGFSGLIRLNTFPRRNCILQYWLNHRARTAMTLPHIKTDMNQEEMNLLLVQARKASDLLKSLSHETRLMILCILSEGEKSVSELEGILAMPQAAVSQQLARLRLDGLVDTRREGRMIYYSILDHEVSSVIGTLYSLFCAPVRNEADKSG